MNPSIIDVNDEAKEEFVDLRTKSVLKSQFQTDTLDEFWCSQVHSFPLLTKRAMNMLIPFVTTYVCEAGFSTMLNIKSKNRNKLDIEHDMRVALSCTKPRIDKIVKKKQEQTKH